MGRVCGNEKLRYQTFFPGIFGIFLEDIPYIGNKGLLNLCVKVNFWFFNKYQMTYGSVDFRIDPLQMVMSDLNGNINQIFEPKAIIGLREFMIK